MTLFDAFGIVLTVTCVALLRMTDIIWMQSGGVAAAETATVGIACGADTGVVSP